MGSEDLASSAEINVPKTIVAWNYICISGAKMAVHNTV
jgi:hypothetical protein